MTPESKEEFPEAMFRNYAWNYFELHANQRLKAFQFYITLSTALVGVFAVLVKSGNVSKAVSALGFGLFLLSFIFWKLEERTRELVKNAEEALKYLDDRHKLPDAEGKPHPLRLFSHDDYKTASKAKLPILHGHFSYSRCFRWVFFIFAVIGLWLDHFKIYCT